VTWLAKGLEILRFQIHPVVVGMMDNELARRATALAGNLQADSTRTLAQGRLLGGFRLVRFAKARKRTELTA
jgi:hypothetical protein